MKKLDRWQTGLMLVVAIAAVSLSRDIDIDGNSELSWIEYAIGVLFALSAAAIAKLVSNWISKFTRVRKLIMGKDYVEGYWLLQTNSVTGSMDSSLLEPGVAHMRYENNSQEFCVDTYRLDDSGILYTTKSEVAHIRTTGPTIRYLNYFRLSGPQHDARYGFSSGTFSLDHHSAPCPAIFEASISVQNEDRTRKQFARRIPDNLVSKYRKANGFSWMEHFLEDFKRTSSPNNDVDRWTALEKLINDDRATPAEKKDLQNVPKRAVFSQADREMKSGKNR